MSVLSYLACPIVDYSCSKDFGAPFPYQYSPISFLLLVQYIRDATLQSEKIRKFDKDQNLANKCMKWSIMV